MTVDILLKTPTDYDCRLRALFYLCYSYDINFLNILDFSLSSWLTSKGYKYSSYLGDGVTAELLETLGIVGFLNETQCDRKSSTYAPSAYGWKRSMYIYIFTYIDLYVKYSYVIQ